jgi:trehalose 6-phosphate phosphatase
MLLFLDYDGTLADFAPTPEDVSPDPQVVDLLRRLAAHPSLEVAVISGRRLSHLRELVPVEGCTLAGTYGIERLTSEGEQVERLQMEAIRPLLDRLKPRWEQVIAGQPGMYLEDKGWSLALHARFAGEEAARQAVEAARREAGQLIDLENPQGLFRQHGGPRFYEICPAIADKGQVVQDLLEKSPWPGALPIFLGDDYNDEQAFKVVNAHGGLTILIARQPRPSAASFRLESPQAARRWLEQLLDSLPPARPSVKDL